MIVQEEVFKKMDTELRKKYELSPEKLRYKADPKEFKSTDKIETSLEAKKMKKKERKKMDKKLLFILILILPFLLGFRTPAGIKVIVNEGVPAQYESHWGLKWEDVNWQGIDDFFFAYGEFYQSKYPKLKLKPKSLIVKIRAFDETCVDETPNSREMRTAYGCIDGLFDPYTASIHLHLGDDSVQGENSWCATALEHELKHYFLLKIHSGCWLGIDRKNSKCDQLNPSPYELGLCH